MGRRPVLSPCPLPPSLDPPCARVAPPTARRPSRPQVLIALADELGNFVEYVGGPAHAAALLTPLELLSTVEETLVRDKAVESLRKVARQLSREHLLEHVLPLTKRLAQGD